MFVNKVVHKVYKHRNIFVDYVSKTILGLII